MKISKQELRRVFETVGKAIDGKDLRLTYIEFSKEDDDVVAIACNAYLLLKTKVEAEFTEDYSIYVKAFKIDKKDTGFFDIKVENNRTVIRNEEDLSTQAMPINFPNLKNVEKSAMRESYIAKVCLDKNILKDLLASSQKNIKFYITDKPNNAVKVNVDDNVDGVMIPFAWSD